MLTSFTWHQTYELICSGFWQQAIIATVIEQIHSDPLNPVAVVNAQDTVTPTPQIIELPVQTELSRLQRESPDLADMTDHKHTRTGPPSLIRHNPFSENVAD